MRLAVLFLVGQIIACGSRGSASPPPAPVGGSSLSGSSDNSLPITLHPLEGTPEDAPLIATKARAISLDGAKVASIDADTVVKTPPTKSARVDDLFRVLHARSDKWKAAHPGESSSGRASFTFERDEPASVVKSVVTTVAYAGYPYAALLVRRPLPKGDGYGPGYLNLDVRIGEPTKGEHARELNVSLSSRGVVLLKWEERGKMVGDKIVSEVQVAKLATDIEHSWNEHGLHREPNDKRFDQAVLHVENDTPYALLVATLDALHATKRRYAVSGKEELVPAINANLVAD